MYKQGDADYLRYRGLQEFDQAMQHLEDKYGVCLMCTKYRILLYSYNVLRYTVLLHPICSLELIKKKL